MVIVQGHYFLPRTKECVVVLKLDVRVVGFMDLAPVRMSEVMKLTDFPACVLWFYGFCFSTEGYFRSELTDLC